MPWFNVDDGSTFHPKVLMAGNAAWGAFVRLGAFAAKHVAPDCEGFVPDEIVRMVTTKGELAKLLSVGFLHRVEGGVQLHDYLDYNRDANTVARARAKAAERKRRQRERDAERDIERDSHGVTSRVTGGVSHRPQAKPSQAKPIATSSPTSAAAEMGDAAAAAISLLIEHKVALEATRNPAGYRRKLSADLPVEHGEAIRSFLADNPDATPTQIASQVLGLTELDLHRLGKETA